MPFSRKRISPPMDRRIPRGLRSREAQIFAQAVAERGTILAPFPSEFLQRLAEMLHQERGGRGEATFGGDADRQRRAGESAFVHADSGGVARDVVGRPARRL